MRRQGGFTLIEVMLALSILAVALVGLIGRTASNIRRTQEVSMLGVATELARGKMYDVEAQLAKDGFQELEQSSDGDFSDEGWPLITWEAKVEKIELPSMAALGAMQGEGEAGAEAGATGLGGGLLGGMLGGAGATDAETAGDLSFITSQFELISQVLEVSLRKVVLTVRWKVGGEDHEMVVATYLTDPEAMSKVIGGMGSSPAGGSEGGDEGGVGGGVGGGGAKSPRQTPSGPRGNRGGR